VKKDQGEGANGVCRGGEQGLSAKKYYCKNVVEGKGSVKYRVEKF